MTRRMLLATAATGVLMAQSDKKVRVGFIGTGHRAWAHIAALKAIPGYEIIALSDPTPEFLNKAAQLAGPQVKTYPDYATMLSKAAELDAVFVVTPGGLHADPAIAALKRGLHVLCEKPMATSGEDADRMIAAAGQSGRILQIGQQMRYTPIYQKLHELVESGQIGTVQFVSGNLFRSDWNPQSWRVADPKTKAPTIWRFLTRYTGSSLLEDGIHEIDVLNWIVGNPVASVYATGGNNVLKNRETIDHAAIAITYENGVKFDFAFSIFAPTAGPVGRQMTFIGTEGLIHAEPGKLELRRRGEPSRNIPLDDNTPTGLLQQQVGRDLDNGTYRQALAFLESVTTGRKPVCDGKVGREVMRISLLAERSLRERRIVNWGESV
jgi:predicted dehydrogenase